MPSSFNHTSMMYCRALTERNGPVASDEDYKTGNKVLHFLFTLHPANILDPPWWIYTRNMLTAWTCRPNTASSSQPCVSLVVLLIIIVFWTSLNKAFVFKMCFFCYSLPWVKTKRDLIPDRFTFILYRNTVKELLFQACALFSFTFFFFSLTLKEHYF